MKRSFMGKITATVLCICLFSQNVYALTPVLESLSIGDVDADGAVTAADAATVLTYTLDGNILGITTENMKALLGKSQDNLLTADDAALVLQLSLSGDELCSDSAFNFNSLEKGEYTTDCELNGFVTLMGKDGNPIEVDQRADNDEFFDLYPTRARLMGGGEVESNYIKITLDEPSVVRIVASNSKMISTVFPENNTVDKYGAYLNLCNESFEVIDSFNSWYPSRDWYPLGEGIRATTLYSDGVLPAGTYYLSALTESGIDIEEIAIYQF